MKERLKTLLADIDPDNITGIVLGYRDSDNNTTVFIGGNKHDVIEALTDIHVTLHEANGNKKTVPHH